MPPLRNLWRYYPERKGLCTGVVLAFFGLSAVIFNAFSNVIINPEGKSLDEKTQFYPEDVGRNVPTFFFYCFLITLAGGVLSVLLVFSYEEEKEENYLAHVDEVNKNDLKV